MKYTFTVPEMESFEGLTANPLEWTVVIPAAGRGTRLGYHLPKILFPVEGRTLLEILINKLSPYFSRFIFVINEQFHDEISAEAEKFLKSASCSYVYQNNPLGMGDAVRLGLEPVETKLTMVIWGDHVSVDPKTVFLAQKMFALDIDPTMVVPTVQTADPYIVFNRNQSGAIEEVLQKREGEVQGVEGENDCGLFLFKTERVRELLSNSSVFSKLLGAQTREYNFLPLIPILQKVYDRVLTLRVSDKSQTLGVNSSKDVGQLKNSVTIGLKS